MERYARKFNPYLYDEEEQVDFIYYGTEREVRSLYKRMEKNGFVPLYVDDPKFCEGGMYAIVSPENGYFYVVDSDTVTEWLWDGELFAITMKPEYYVPWGSGFALDMGIYWKEVEEHYI